MKSVLSKQNKTTVGSCTYLWVFSVCITLWHKAVACILEHMDPSLPSNQQSCVLTAHVRAQRSEPNLMTCQSQPTDSPLHQPICSTDNSWHGPPWMPRSRGDVVSGVDVFDLVWPCLIVLFPILLLVVREETDSAWDFVWESLVEARNNVV